MNKIPPIGSAEFRSWARKDLLLAQPGELCKEHEWRLYRALHKIDKRFTAGRVHDLLYDPGCALKDWQGRAIRRLVSGAIPQNTLDKQNRNLVARLEKLERLFATNSEQQRKMDDEMLCGVKGLLEVIEKRVSPFF